MNKKTIIILIIIMLLAVVVFAIFNGFNNDENSTNIFNRNEIVQGMKNVVEENNNTKKILVVYFSAQNHTETIAKQVAKNLNADIFEIIPVNEYTEDDLNKNDINSRVSKEHSDESLRNVKLKTTKVDNWEYYDVVLIGYPIWYEVSAWPVDSFVRSNDFRGKTVIPFCTSAFSGLDESAKLLESKTGTGKWLEGHSFESNSSETDIKKWTDSLNLN